MIPELSVAWKWKSSCQGTKKLSPQQTAGFPPGQEDQRVSGQEDRLWCFPPSAQPAVGPQRPLGPYSRRPAQPPAFCKQLCPSPPSAARAQNTPATGAWTVWCQGIGGNIKQGWKTGSESLNSQAGSLEGAGWRRGRLGLPREASAARGGKFPGRSLLAPQQGAPCSACLRHQASSSS